MDIKFNELKPLHKELSREIKFAVNRVLKSGWYILGPEVEAFEKEFAEYHDTKHAVAVANGTDAIELALRASGVGPGDEVITVSHTAVATICAIERAGAIPVLVDINPRTYTMDVDLVESVITERTKAIVPVHIYGYPVEMDKLVDIARKYKLLLVEDCAQAHGAEFRGRKVGTFGHIAAFSFYPTKNLGAYGDGGAILTNNSEIAKKLIRLRNYGQISRYEFVEWGVNSRMDEIQAAILRVKLKHLDEQNAERRKIASRYSKLLKNVILPLEEKDYKHAYHLFVVRHDKRDALQNLLTQNGVGTLIHYPLPVHMQPAYKHLGYNFGCLPITEEISEQIISLPIYFGLDDKAIKYVSKIVNNAKLQ